MLQTNCYSYRGLMSVSDFLFLVNVDGRQDVYGFVGLQICNPKRSFEISDKICTGRLIRESFTVFQ